MSFVVFLSAVSSEFHAADPERQTPFESYRDALALALRRLGPEWYVITQEDLPQGPGDLLEKLDREIASADLVVHLIGHLAGFIPTSAECRRLQERHSQFLQHEPELAQSLVDKADVSYTQWEAYLAFHHRRCRLIYLAASRTPRSPGYVDTEPDASQRQHVARLEKVLGEDREPFKDQSDLALKVVTSTIRYGLGNAAGGKRAPVGVFELARSKAADLVGRIAGGIRKPNHGLPPDADPGGVATFLHSIDTAAPEFELNRRQALELAEEYVQNQRENLPSQPDSKSLYDLALAELATGNSADALALAQQAVEIVVEEDQEQALNAFLLLFDLAQTYGAQQDAIRAIETACSLVNRESSPILWADVHETYAEYLFNNVAGIDRADDLVSEIVDIREALQPDSVALAKSLLLWCGLLGVKANFAGMVGVAERAEQIFAGQPDQPQVGIPAAITWRATALKDLGRYAESEPLMRRALEICESCHGPEYPEVAKYLNNLAALLLATNRLSEAEPLMRRALAIDEFACGPEHPDVARDLNNLAQLLHTMNRFAEAEPLIRRALSIDETFFGPEHPMVARDLNNLASLLQLTNRLAEAEPLRRRALSIDESFYGPDHPIVAIRLNNLASLLNATNRLEEAEPLMRRALSIDESSYGAGHPSVANRLNNLALLLKDTNRLSEAEPLMGLALQLFFRSLGAEHPSTMLATENYEIILHAMGLSKEEAKAKTASKLRGEPE